MEVLTDRWAIALGLVSVLLVIDLGASVMRPHVVSFRESAAVSVAYIAIALAFGGVVWAQSGSEAGLEYLAGYVVEKSLSVDNLFVFVIIMTSFAVPRPNQQQVLVIGIVLALAMRAVMIALGAALIELFSFMFLVFGLALVVTAVQLFRHRDASPRVQDNPVVRATRRLLPVTDRFHGGRLVVHEDGRRVITPLLLALVAIGTTDVLFALDSIPAVFGVTQDAYIVFTANAFALLGLRALYFLVSGLLDRLVYLSVGLSVILAFIGCKLLLHWAHTLHESVPQPSTPVSLAFVLLVLAATTVASVVRVRARPDLRAAPGALTGPDPEPREETGTHVSRTD